MRLGLRASSGGDWRCGASLRGRTETRAASLTAPGHTICAAHRAVLLLRHLRHVAGRLVLPAQTSAAQHMRPFRADARSMPAAWWLPTSGRNVLPCWAHRHAPSTWLRFAATHAAQRRFTPTPRDPSLGRGRSHPMQRHSGRSPMPTCRNGTSGAVRIRSLMCAPVLFASATGTVREPLRPSRGCAAGACFPHAPGRR